jgi:TPR repeat protein
MDSVVFISFASKDRGFATTICDALERRGIGCWIAIRDIGPGENFQHAVFHAIRAAKLMVLVFSGNSQNSDEVKKEIVLAGQCKLSVIPVRVEDVTPDGAFAYELATRQWVDLFDDWERSIQRLVEQIVKITGQQPTPVVVPLHEPPAPAPEAAAPPAPRPQPARPAPAVTMEPAPEPRRPQTGSIAALVPNNQWLGIGGAGVLVLAVLIAAVWLWPGGARQTVPPGGTVPVSASTAEALSKGKTAFERRDYAEALRWMRQAADQGNAEAQAYVGYLYEKGLGVSQDNAAALGWYRKSAAQGHAAAQRNIGNFYEQGLGVPRDYGEAMRWFRLAADQGNPGAETNIGYLYEQGLGVPQDYAEALRWYRKAADQGQATAQSNIGVFFDKGYGVAQNFGEAARWYRMAANQGNVDAEYNLALLYADGRGVPPDLAEARQLMQRAAAAGDAEAKKWLGDNGQ